MTITLENEQVYLLVILILMAIQVYQLKRISDLRKECDRIWNQIGSFALGLSSKIQDMEKDIEKKQDK